MKNAQSLIEAQTALAGIETRRAKIIGRRNELGGKIEVVERSAGERYLDGDRGAAKELSELRTEIDLCERALAVLDDQERLARVELKRATAADMRRQATERRAQLEALTKQTAKFLAELSKIEGVAYTQSILSEARTGHWYEPLTNYMAAPEYLPNRECIRETGGPNTGGFAVPLSARLRQQANKLDLDAEQIEIELANAEPPADLQDAA
jgi:hypothetical protein